MRRYRAAWVVLIALGALLEAAALSNDVDGDTLSALVWAVLDAAPVLAVPLGLGLTWLTVHWLGRTWR